jgi:repressor LexA
MVAQDGLDQRIVGVAERFQARGEVPTQPQIATEVGVALSTVWKHLQALRDLGLVELGAKHQRRAIKLVGVARPALVPLLGSIAAGPPISAIPSEQGRYPLPLDLLEGGELFMLLVEGDSMVEAGVHDRDYVVVDPGAEVAEGQMVAALLPSSDGESRATVKYLGRTGDGGIVLMPANPAVDPIDGGGARVMGRVVAVLRTRVPAASPQALRRAAAQPATSAP